MAEFSAVCPLKIDMLVVYDIDTRVASQLAEKFVSNTTKFDLIIILGPFTHDKKLISNEDIAVAEGDMASAIAQLENISCRVVYLPGENDPLNTLIEQLHLTPNSVNLHARRLPLRDGLFITGFTETGENLEKRGVPDDFDRSEESDEELEDVEVSSGTNLEIMITTAHSFPFFFVVFLSYYPSFICIVKSIMKLKIDLKAAFKNYLSID
jgi:Icc-related predicted phosphoesterase